MVCVCVCTTIYYNIMGVYTPMCVHEREREKEGVCGVCVCVCVCTTIYYNIMDVYTPMCVHERERGSMVCVCVCVCVRTTTYYNIMLCVYPYVCI